MSFETCDKDDEETNIKKNFKSVTTYVSYRFFGISIRFESEETNLDTELSRGADKIWIIIIMMMIIFFFYFGPFLVPTQITDVSCILVRFQKVKS